MDYYKILGISNNASSEEIKKAFHKLAHKHHPHKGGDEKKFKEINEAYQILSNKEKRSQYDRFGTVFEGGSPGAGQEGFNWAWGNFSPGSGPNIDFDLGDLSEIFGDLFNFGRRTRAKDFKRGKNIRIDIAISLEEALKGISKEILLNKYAFCSRCDGTGAEPNTLVKECFSCRGTGKVQQIKKTPFGSFTHESICPECKGEGQRPEKPCNVCQGEGRIKQGETIKIYIPAGIDSNQIIKISGKGNTGKRQGTTGDLYVRILVKQHPVFERRGDDLFVAVPITFSQAALGAKIEIPTLTDRNIILKVPTGTESGKVLKVSGKGIPHFSGFGKGSLYVQLIVETPKKLSREQKELLRKLKEQGL